MNGLLSLCRCLLSATSNGGLLLLRRGCQIGEVRVVVIIIIINYRIRILNHTFLGCGPRTWSPPSSHCFAFALRVGDGIVLTIRTNHGLLLGSMIRK